MEATAVRFIERIARGIACLGLTGLVVAAVAMGGCAKEENTDEQSKEILKKQQNFQKQMMEKQKQEFGKRR